MRSITEYLTHTAGPLRMRRTLAVAAGGACLALFTPASAQAPDLGRLESLQSGEWTIRDRETRSSSRICLKSGTELIRLRHGSDGACKNYLVEDGPSRIAVQYSCRKSSYGLTTIRRESSTLVQVTSEGMSNGRPFSFSAEARRTGAC